MQYSADNVQTIIDISKYVLGEKMLAYVKNLANGLKTPNDKSGCGCICGMKSLYNFICQAEWRQNEMTNNENYQFLISQIFKCMSLQPSYYTYLGGGNVINATVPSGGGGTGGYNYSWAEFNMPIQPAADVTIIPISSADKQTLTGVTITNILREGIAMQRTDDTRPDYFSFDPSTGEVTLSSAANGDEIFQIIYKTLVLI